MDNSQGNPGSFMAPVGQGLGSAVQEAMNRRGLLAQNSQNPQTLPSPAPSSTPQPPMGSASSAPSPTPTLGGAVNPNESEMIIRALDTKLKSLSKIQEAQVGIR